MKKIFTIIAALVFSATMYAQSRKLVWSDEFNGTQIDQTKWKFGSGTTYDNLPYYTRRNINTHIVNGKLQIIKLKESYKGLNYTSALLITNNPVNWKYRRVEARIKLPVTREKLIIISTNHQ